MKIINEFKEFAMRGNVIDMAVGIIIGGAFGKIVSSVVNDVIMPPIGLLIGGINFSDMKIPLKDATVDATGAAVPAVTLNIGNFIQTTIDFLFLAVCIFILVKLMNKLKKKEEPVPAPVEPKLSTTDELLTEIKEILKEKK